MAKRPRFTIDDDPHVQVVMHSGDNQTGPMLNAARALFAFHQIGADKHATNCPIPPRRVLPWCFRGSNECLGRVDGFAEGD